MKHFTKEEVHKMTDSELIENIKEITEEVENLIQLVIANQALQNKN